MASSLRVLSRIGIWCFLIVTASRTQAAEPARRAIPTPASRKEARALIAEAFETDIQQADTPQRKQLLAQKLLRVAAETLDHPAGRYELLETARRMAAEAGDVDAAMAAVKQLDAVFDVDGARLKAAALYQFSKTFSRPDELKPIVPQMLALVDETLATDRYEIAVPLVKVALATAKAARDKELLEAVERQQTQVETMKTAHEAIQPALMALRVAPRDAKANLAVGRYACLLQGRWKKGLPRLALGADPNLKRLAMMETSDSPDALILGDGWWELAESERGRARKNLQSHAATWYRRALPRLAGLAKIKVEKRLQELGPPPVESMAASRRPPRSPVLPGAPQPMAPPSGASPKMVKFGLNWLAENQLGDGGWTFQTGGNPGTCKSRVGATAMVLLAFLRHGHTHREGDYREQVKQGLVFLGRAMKIGPTGGDLSDMDGTMYAHGLATMALCEAYARTKDAKLRRAAGLAVAFIVYAQDPTGGGWRYKPRQSGDTSVTGWQVQALKLADAAGIDVPAATYAGVRQFLLSVQTDNGASFGYTNPGSGARTSAIGLFCQLELGADQDDPDIQRGIKRLASQAKMDSPYFSYYFAHLLRRNGGEQWAAHSQKVVAWLRKHRRTEGPEAESWYYGNDLLTSKAGRLGVAAFSLLILAECQR